MKDMRKTIVRVQNQDKDTMEKMIAAFSLLLKKYARKLAYEDAEQDLIVFFIELLRSFPIERFHEGDDGKIVSYIKKAVIHQYYKLDRKNRKYEVSWEEINREPAREEDDVFTCQEEWNSLLECLTDQQRKVFVLRVCYQYSDQEIGTLLGISRQAVYKERKKAIAKLKEEMEES